MFKPITSVNPDVNTIESETMDLFTESVDDLEFSDDTDFSAEAKPKTPVRLKPVKPKATKPKALANDDLFESDDLFVEFDTPEVVPEPVISVTPKSDLESTNAPITDVVAEQIEDNPVEEPSVVTVSEWKEKITQAEEEKQISGLGKKIIGIIRSIKKKFSRKGKQKADTKRVQEKEVNIPIIYILIVIALLMGGLALCSGLLLNHYDKTRRATEFSNLESGQMYRIEKIKIGDIIKVDFREQNADTQGELTTFKYKHDSVDDAYYRLFKYYLRDGDYVVYTDTHELNRVVYNMEVYGEEE